MTNTCRKIATSALASVAIFGGGLAFAMGTAHADISAVTATVEQAVLGEQSPEDVEVNAGSAWK